MAIIRKKELKGMNKEEMENKVNELKLELTKANVTANRATAKTKEIKRTIARLNTFNKPRKEEEAKRK